MSDARVVSLLMGTQGVVGCLCQDLSCAFMKDSKHLPMSYAGDVKFRVWAPIGVCTHAFVQYSQHTIFSILVFNSRAKDLHVRKNANFQGLLPTMDDGQGWPGAQFM